MGGGGSPLLLHLRVVVLTLTLVEEKDTPALPSGLASQFVPVARLSISVGLNGPSAREELQQLERAGVGTDALRTLFSTSVKPCSPGSVTHLMSRL